MTDTHLNQNQVELNLAKELKKFQVLYELAIAMTADRSLDDILQMVVEKCRELLGTDTAYAAGLIIYPRRPIHGLAGDHVLVAPPLNVTPAEADEILNRLEQALVKAESSVSNA